MTIGGTVTGTKLTKQASITTPEYYNNLYTKQQTNFDNHKNMIAHQRLPIHVEYLQPYNLTTSETKASPLALLAATCSSIGKSDAEKKDLKTTTTTPTILSKLSPSQESKKSSFKPYKIEDRHTPPTTPVMRSSPPILVSNSNIVSSKIMTVPSVNKTNNNNNNGRNSVGNIREKNLILNPGKEYEEYAKYHERLTRDMKDNYQSTMKCHTISPPLPHLPSKVPMLPHTPNHSDCIQCKTVRPHSDSISSVSRPPTGPHQCSCPMCHNRTDAKCHYQTHPSTISSIYHPGHKSTPLPLVMACRDPSCTNCTKMPTNKTLQNFVHPALIHQCTHNSPPHKSPYQPPPTAQSAYDSYFNKNVSTQQKPKPYVCNWVSEGKHCGNNFVTSEELYQHLRSHTSLQKQRNNENVDTPSIHPPLSAHSVTPSSQPQGACNIHGCPCGAGQRKSSPRPMIPSYTYNTTAPSGLRYTPYARPVSTGTNPITGHSFGPPPHSIYHY